MSRGRRDHHPILRYLTTHPILPKGQKGKGLSSFFNMDDDADSTEWGVDSNPYWAPGMYGFVILGMVFQEIRTFLYEKQAEIQELLSELKEKYEDE